MPHVEPIFAPVFAPVFATLAAEIRSSVRQAIDTLENVSNGAGTLDSVMTASTLFHQVGAALRLAGVDGVPALTELLQRVLASVSSASLPLTASLAGAVRLGGNAVLAYLDALIRGRPQPSLSLFPAYRALYALQGGGDVSPAALLSLRTVSSLSLPSLQISADDIPDQPADTLYQSDNPREQYEQALLNYLRSSDAEVIQHAAQRMFEVICTIAHQQRSKATLSHWLVLQAFAQMITAGARPVSAKKILAGTGRLIRHLEDKSEDQIALQLVREALYEIACADVATPLTVSIKVAFNLDWQVPAGYDSELSELPAEQAEQDTDQARSLERFAAALAEVKIALENSAAESLLAATDVPAALRTLASQAHSMQALAGLSGCLQQLAERSSTSGLQRQHAVPLAACLLFIEQGLQQPEQIESWCTRNAAIMQAMLDCSMQSSDLQQASVTLPCLPGSSQRQSVAPLLTATIGESLQTLALLESRIDAALQDDSISSAWPAIDGMLGQISGALSLIGKSQVVGQVQELRQTLAAVAAEQDGADRSGNTLVLATRFATLVQQVTMLNFQTEPAEEKSVQPAEPEEALAVQTETVTTEEKSDDKVLLLSPALHAIYLEEAQQCISHISQSLRQWCSAPQSALLEAAGHALHTLAGSSAAVSLHTVHELATTLECLLQEFMLTRTQQLAAAEQTLLLDAVALLEQMLAQLLTDQLPAQQPALLQQLLSLLQQKQVCKAEPAVLTEPGNTEMPAKTAESEAAQPLLCTVDDSASDNHADPELLALFIEEATDLLSQIDQLLRAWQVSEDAPASVPSLLRILHTLKGSARMAGAAELGEALHQIEHALTQTETVQLASLLADFDRIMQLFAQLVSAASPAPGLGIVANREQGVIRRAPQTAAQVQLRVRPELLDRVANSAAELVVGGARVSGELQQQRHVLAELNDNLARLRSQLRELEIQAETQIASGVTLNTKREFDPLEFDRFTSLQELTRMMAETVADIASVQRMLSRHIDGAALAMTAQLRHARTLQNDFRRVRIVQFSSIAERLQLLVRQVASELERQVRLELHGGSIEVDRSMLEKISAPLEHLLRNAIAHGIELPQQRLAVGKPAAGTIQITLAQHGNDIVMQVSDDGRGLDGERIHEQAIRAGLIADDALLTDAEIANLIFEPGLTTSDKVTALSGRGIGMDAVRADLLAQGGTIKVSTTSGSGTCFTLILPLTLATTQVVLAIAGGMQVALPSAMVEHVLQLPVVQCRAARQSGTLDWRGEQLPLHNLAGLLALAATNAGTDEQPVPVVILRQLDALQAIELDAITGNREVVVKPIGAQLAHVAGLAGATVLADASIVLIINPLPLIEAAMRRQHAGMFTPASTVPVVTAEKVLPLVLIVDDSLTVRRVSQRLLEKHGYATELARDGFDALEKLAALGERKPEVMLCDIEMPRMDGFDFLRHVRQDPQHASTPVVMISSRTAARHREHALALGATAYLGKPFQETALLALLAQFCIKSNSVTS